jgi:perosamine synthetase
MVFKYPVYEPTLIGNEKKYVNECLDTTWISSRGRFVKAFEEEFATYLGTESATTVCNGTVALHLALLALGLQPGDEVIVPTLTYIATVNAIRYIGATPVFADSDREFWQLDVSDVEKKITSRTKAVIAVHLYGGVSDLSKLVAMCKQNNLFLVEDCSESIGTLYRNQHTGTFGDIATFSFFGNKTITTGEGGMVTSRNQTLIDNVSHLKNQGVSSKAQYLHDVIGYNYRMTNICAAIGLAQLEKISTILEMKKGIAVWYSQLFEGTKISLQPEHPDCQHSYWMCSILLPENISRDELKNYLDNYSIETRPVFYPIHTMTIYAHMTRNGQFPVACEISRRGITLPSYPSLCKEDIEFIALKIIDFVNSHG